MPLLSSWVSLSGVEPKPIVVRIVEQAPRHLGWGDVFLGAAAISLLLLLISALMGGVLGTLFIWLKKRNPLNQFNGDRASEPFRLKIGN